MYDMTTHFKEHGYQVIRGWLTPQTANVLSNMLHIHRDNWYRSNNLPLDVIGYTPNKENETIIKEGKFFSSYGFMDALLLELLPAIREVTGKNLQPSYSYSRIYYNGADMGRHKDRESCEYSATLTLGMIGETPWDIWVQDYDGTEKPISLYPGDIMIYKGDEIDHWRETFTGELQYQTFLHFIDMDGENSDHFLDKRSMLGEGF
jgi:hypothetical protein